jgi:hypothetical protein
MGRAPGLKSVSRQWARLVQRQRVARRQTTAIFGNCRGSCSPHPIHMPPSLLSDLAGHCVSASSSLSSTIRFASRTQWRTPGSPAQSFLYACHPLFAVSAGDRVLLPSEIREVRLDYSKGDRLGASGSILPWPATKSGLRLDVALGPEAGTAEMFYTPRLQDGLCGIYREASAQVLEVSFDTRRLPFLGLWLCYGGWPDDGKEPQQYAVALEPTTSPMQHPRQCATNEHRHFPQGR